MAKWATVSVSFPDASQFTDEELAELLPSRDGRWSSAVKAAQEKFGACGLDLDANWAATPVGWSCPGCNRSKPELLRINKGGILLARLDLHHDHLEDYIKDRLREGFGQEWPRLIPTDTHHIEQAGSVLLRRFAPTLVCIDCNNADGFAKNQVAGIHRHFTFRPSEMATFISVSPNQEHRGDPAKAAAAWERARPDFQQRLILADLLIDKINAGALTSSHGNIPVRGHDAGLLPLYFLNEWFVRTTSDGFSVVQRSIDQLLSHSLAREGTASRVAPRKITAKADTPSESDVREYDGGGSPRLWAKAEDSWRCPGCARGKHEILRPSNNRKRRWSGKIHEHQEYLFERFEIFGDEDATPDFYVDHHQTLLICSDCLSVITELKQRNPKFARQEFLLQVADLQAAVQPQPNTRHEVDWAAVATRAEANLQKASAVETYWRQYRDAIHCRNTYEALLSVEAGDQGRAKARLFAAYRERSPDRSTSEVLEDIEYLLSEAERLAPTDRKKASGAVN